MIKSKLISVLGTGKYKTCNYDEFRNCKYIQEALVRKHQHEIDEVVVFATAEAIASNWTGDEALEKTFEKLKEEGIKFEYRLKEIPLGVSEDEVWQIFDIIVEEIEEGDSLFLDITHGFRYQPMLIMSILNYVKLIKNVTVEGIEYGMFEVLGSPSEVEKIPVEDRNAPILNLTLLDQLNDWVVATDSFLTTGSVSKIDELTKKEINKVLALTRGSDQFFNNLKKVVKNLKDFHNCINTARGNKLNDCIIRTLETLNELDRINQEYLKNKRVKPFIEIIDKINDKFKNYSVKEKDKINNYFKVLKWCEENDFIQQALVILRENLISFVLDQKGYDVHNKNYRQDVSYVLNYLSSDKINESNTWYIDKKFFNEIKEYIKNNYGNLPQLFSEVGDIRNDISHFGLTDSPISNPDRFKEKLIEFIKKIESCNLISKV